MNSIVTISNNQAVTTSFAIAAGTEVQHKNVIELVRIYQADLEEFGRVAFETSPFETAGGMQQREIAILNEQQSTLLLTYMRNNDIVRKFKKRLVKEFYDLVRSPIDPMKILSDPAAMRGLLLTYTEKVLSLESKVGELTPKAAALELISASNDALTFTEAAKILDVKRKDLFLRLQTERWIYRRNGSWLGYDEHIKNGDLQYKEANFTNDDGMEVKKPYSHITPKGLTKLACMFSVELEAA